MEGATPAPETADVVFIADDDEDLLLEDEWQVETEPTANFQQHAGQIQLQLRLCILAAVLIPVLATLIAFAWRRYGAIISQAALKQKAT